MRQSLRTADLALARRRLRDLSADLEQTGASGEQLTLRQLCERYLNTTLHRAAKTVATKRRACNAILTDWLEAGRADLEGPALAGGDLARRLQVWRGGYIHYLEFIRAAFALAVNNGLLAHSPVDGIKIKRRAKPLRATPTEGEFQAIVANIRGKPFRDTAGDSEGGAKPSSIDRPAPPLGLRRAGRPRGHGGPAGRTKSRRVDGPAGQPLRQRPAGELLGGTQSRALHRAAACPPGRLQNGRSLTTSRASTTVPACTAASATILLGRLNRTPDTAKTNPQRKQPKPTPRFRRKITFRTRRPGDGGYARGSRTGQALGTRLRLTRI